MLAGSGVLAATLLAGCRPNSVPLPPALVPALTPTTAAEMTGAAAVDLRRKLAQMVLVGFRGATLDAANPIVADIRDRDIGGVVLFSYDCLLYTSPSPRD